MAFFSNRFAVIHFPDIVPSLPEGKYSLSSHHYSEGHQGRQEVGWSELRSPRDDEDFECCGTVRISMPIQFHMQDWGGPVKDARPLCEKTKQKTNKTVHYLSFGV
ncbi:hypothetical protein GOODEAATRI_020491 [Goodea atripinnis]|uniref:Uncharacterized protein n=1 Tax=Goodea atripinnis TaxID=208336 RepID=A0ABV0PQ72_9TELE